jgi:hypothetical protein
MPSKRPGKSRPSLWLHRVANWEIAAIQKAAREVGPSGPGAHARRRAATRSTASHQVCCTEWMTLQHRAAPPTILRTWPEAGLAARALEVLQCRGEAAAAATALQCRWLLRGPGLPCRGPLVLRLLVLVLWLALLLRPRSRPRRSGAAAGPGLLGVPSALGGGLLGAGILLVIVAAAAGIRRRPEAPAGLRRLRHLAGAAAGPCWGGLRAGRGRHLLAGLPGVGPHGVGGTRRAARRTRAGARLRPGPRRWWRQRAARLRVLRPCPADAVLQLWLQRARAGG